MSTRSYWEVVLYCVAVCAFGTCVQRTAHFVLQFVLLLVVSDSLKRCDHGSTVRHYVRYYLYCSSSTIVAGQQGFAQQLVRLKRKAQQHGVGAIFRRGALNITHTTPVRMRVRLSCCTHYLR